jgi:beta-glucosidase
LPRGLLAQYFKSADSTGVPVVSQIEQGVRDVSNPPVEFYQTLGLPLPVARGSGPGGPAAAKPLPNQSTTPRTSTPPGTAPPKSVWSARWTGMLIPPLNGTYLFSVTGAGTAQLYVDHKVVATIMRADFEQTVQGTIVLKTRIPVPIELKYSNASVILGPGLALGWHAPDRDMVEKAAAVARQSDVAIVFAAEQLGEGHDKVRLALPGDQDDLIRTIAQANPRTIVVLHNSNPVAMPWLNQVAAVIEAFYPGQEAGSSIARLLFGDVNPSGKLAMTFPANEQQGAGAFFLDYPGDGISVDYSEGVSVGYRWYDEKGQEPLFPFGFGLSYTTFHYSDLHVEHEGTEQVTVKIRVTNSGKREGAEVVQLYLGSPPAAQEPSKQLKGFEKILLKPGESRIVTMRLNGDSLAAWDPETHGWKVHPGAYSVMIGSSSRDIRAREAFSIKY